MSLHKFELPQERFRVRNEDYFLLETNGLTRVVRDRCHHRGGPISLGEYDEKSETVICPWHKMKNCKIWISKMTMPTIRRLKQITFLTKD